jgi:hypothetical protein
MVDDDEGARDPGYEAADSGRRPPPIGLSSSSSFLILHNRPVDLSYLTHANMVKLKAVIDGLGLVSIALGIVPGVGENLKSAAELLSKICEQVQVRQLVSRT